MKVLQVLPGLDEGGVERGTLEIAEALVRDGHQALVMSAGGRMVSALEQLGAQHIEWPIGKKSPLTFRWVPRLRKLLRDRQIDILHARSRLPAWIAYLAWRKMPVANRPRFVTTVHGFYSVSRYSAVMTRGERVIAVSDAIRSYVEQNYPRVDMQRVVTIYRGVDPAAYPRGYQPSAQWREKWCQEAPPDISGRFKILLPGRLRRLKGHEVLLDVIAALHEDGLPVHVLIAGDDTADTEYIRALKRRIAEQALPVSFIGHRSDLKDLYTVVDLVVSLSTQPESFGRTVLEPLCLGTPVMGYDEGGVGEILRNMYPAGLVQRGNTDLLASKLKQLVEHPVAVNTDNPYPLSAMQSRTVQLYESLLKTP